MVEFRRAMTRGVILINVGTPDEPTTGAVRRYLKTLYGIHVY